jgi:hypothetical protein
MDLVVSDHPIRGVMNVMDRVAHLLLGTSFCRYLSSAAKCALDREPRMAPAPSFTLRVLRAALIAALLLIALGPTFVAAASPTPAAGNPSVAELEQLVQTLKDDTERQAFVTQLETLIASHRAVAAKPSEPEDLVSILSDRINALRDELLAGVAVLVDAPLLLAWTKGQIATEYTRALWGQVAYSLLIVFAAGLVAEWIVHRLLARVLPRAPALTRKRLAYRALLVVGGLIIEALPVAAFAGVAVAALAMTIPPFAMARYALSDLIEATIAVRLILAVARSVLVPTYADDNLTPASEETRNYLLIWMRRFTCWGIFGYALAAATWWLGVPAASTRYCSRSAASCLRFSASFSYCRIGRSWPAGSSVRMRTSRQVSTACAAMSVRSGMSLRSFISARFTWLTPCEWKADQALSFARRWSALC